MIPARIREEISRYLGSEPRPYVTPSKGGNIRTGCACWDLAAQMDEDKPASARYQEITRQIISLMEQSAGDPRIATLTKEASGLLEGVPVTKKYGGSFFSLNEMLMLDPLRGIRKEWWDLHAGLSGGGVCVFQGYNSPEAVASRIGDILIVMPDGDQFEFLRMHQTRGNNHPVSTERIIEVLQKLDQEAGVAIVCALSDYVEFVFKKPIEPGRRARIRQKLHRLCPSAEELAEGIRLGRVALWWD